MYRDIAIGKLYERLHEWVYYGKENERKRVRGTGNRVEWVDE